jgi:peptide deformylase
MILPIIAYGNTVLRQVCKPIDSNYPSLNDLLSDMWESMYHSNGVGLAAPQINKAIRLFIIDTIQIVEGADDEDKEMFLNEKPVKQVFINAQILDESGEEWLYNEGCLSIPKVRADVARKPNITIQFLDENFVERTKEYSGVTARVIQHEYDHIEGKLFIDKLKPLKRKMLGRKLDDIIKGKVSMGYRLIFQK